MIPLLIGFLSWTLLEYLLHRFVFHQRVLGARPAREHLAHHAEVDWFAPWRSKLAMAVVALSALTAVLAPMIGLGGALAHAVGVVGGWLIYEAIHRSIHVRPPKTAYGRWACRHHLYHHFMNPKANHGVSSPFWDVVFGTFVPVTRVTVPRRGARRIPWLLHDDAISASVADTYALPPERDAVGA
jgi:sterol desaturase/sphingolipid hydroxylase (fatty acid hydroxylase superfamily)